MKHTESARPDPRFEPAGLYWFHCMVEVLKHSASQAQDTETKTRLRHEARLLAGLSLNTLRPMVRDLKRTADHVYPTVDYTPALRWLERLEGDLRLMAQDGAKPGEAWDAVPNDRDAVILDNLENLSHQITRMQATLGETTQKLANAFNECNRSYVTINQTRIAVLGRAA